MVDKQRKNPKKRLGRPPKAPSERRGVTITMRLTEDELARVRAAAKREGVTVTELLLRPWQKKRKG